MNSREESFITKVFPVPKTLVLSNVSIDISDGILRFFEFSRSACTLNPKSYDSMPFPRIHLGVSNEKLKSEAVSNLKTFSSQKGYRNVHAIVHEAEAYVFKATVPTVVAGELRPAIEAILEENIPIPPVESVFEYDIVRTDRERGETTVAVSVINEKILNQYGNILSAGGLLPVSFDIESRALARALFRSGNKDVVIVLSIRSNHSIIFIAEKGVVVFSSSVEVGSADIDRAIEKTWEITPEVAAKFKENNAWGNSKESQDIFNSALPVFSTLHDELVKVLSFWKNQEKKNRDFSDISRIIVSGSDSLIYSFIQYTSTTLGLPVEAGSVWTNAFSIEKNLPELSFRHSLDYGSCIGALL